MKAAVYIMTNEHHTVLYTGVTSNLNERINQHLTGKYPNSFTTRYNIRKLVWFEKFNPMNDAIKREKQLKAGSRNRKLELINRLNPGWIDLSLDLTD